MGLVMDERERWDKERQQTAIFLASNTKSGRKTINFKGFVGIKGFEHSNDFIHGDIIWTNTGTKLRVARARLGLGTRPRMEL